MAFSKNHTVKTLECLCACVCVRGGGGGVIYNVTKNHKFGKEKVTRSQVAKKRVAESHVVKSQPQNDQVVKSRVAKVASPHM